MFYFLLLLFSFLICKIGFEFDLHQTNCHSPLCVIIINTSRNREWMKRGIPRWCAFGHNQRACVSQSSCSPTLCFMNTFKTGNWVGHGLKQCHLK